MTGVAGPLSGLPLADLARLRQAAYRLLAAVLLYPGEERLGRAAAVAAALKADGEALAAFAFYLPWRALLDRLEGAAGRAPALAETFVRLFLVNPEASPCLPHESAHAGGDASAAGAVAARLAAEYAAAGVSVATAGGEPADHAAVELEFMSLLCDREAGAWEARRLPEAVEVLRRQVAFLEAHPARWFPAFARAVAGADSDFYAAAAAAAAAFIGHDLDLQRALLRDLDAGEAA